MNRKNDSDAVRNLQRLLKKARLNPVLVDGVFGPSTHAAVIVFQKSYALLADGIVGPSRAYALGLVESGVINHVLPQFTTTRVSIMFPNTSG